MPSRDEALRKIFEATGAVDRLSEDQARELLAHLDDAVDAKVDAGIPEMEAVGQAFAELGDLKKLRYPAAAAEVATSTGLRLRLWTGGADLGYLLLLAFTAIQLFVTPSLLAVFTQVQVPMPGLTAAFWGLSETMRAWWPAVVLALAALAVPLVRAPRSALRRTLFQASLALGGAALLGGFLVSVFLPLISLLEGVAR